MNILQINKQLETNILWNTKFDKNVQNITYKPATCFTSWEYEEK